MPPTIWPQPRLLKRECTLAIRMPLAFQCSPYRLALPSNSNRCSWTYPSGSGDREIASLGVAFVVEVDYDATSHQVAADIWRVRCDAEDVGVLSADRRRLAQQAEREEGVGDRSFQARRFDSRIAPAALRIVDDDRSRPAPNNGPRTLFKLLVVGVVRRGHCLLTVAQNCDDLSEDRLAEFWLVPLKSAAGFEPMNRGISMAVSSTPR